MSKSIRVRTQPGVDKSIKISIDQEFDYLEILSLKILQSDIYTRQCSDYGVVVGRVSVNNGFGLPNAKISIFIPLDNLDQNNPIISELYPYKTLLDNNDDGYRYNLLPYVKSHSAHVPTGTFFTRNDVLTNPTLIEVYDKYYKYNAVTNESGDFMIFGVPVGSHTIVMDVDLSDIGEFSLSPQDLIRMGLALETQVAGTQFRSSNNLRELPQIINLSKSIEVDPLWGESEICNLGITRTDFDLSSESKIDIRPTSVFMGSIISDSGTNALKSRCKPTNKSGHLCSLVAGPGEILAIRQTIQQDSNNYPILESIALESGGKVIDENGAWLIDVPMNMDYYTTNEFGELVISNDPEIGIPTKAKYRFKIKWNQSPSITELNKRANYLVPNIREYSNISNPDFSYAFSLDWADYGDPQMIQDAINCEDKFYLMQYNKVYTVSGFIHNHRSGSGPERYIGIKNILEESCETENYKFPTNDANFRFDMLYIIFMFFSIILTPVFFALILLLHILYFVVWISRILLIPALIAFTFAAIANQLILALGAIPYALGQIVGHIAMMILYIILLAALGYILVKLWQIDMKGIKVPILTYPDCGLCDCKQGEPIVEEPDEDSPPEDEEDRLIPCPTIYSDPKPISPLNNGLKLVSLTQMGTFRLPIYNAETNINGYNSIERAILSNDFAGYAFDGTLGSSTIGAPYLQSEVIQDPPGSPTVNNYDWFTNGLPIADRINLFNVKAKYFDGNININPGGGVNRISVNFEPTQTGTHLDNTLVIYCDKSSGQKLTPGQMISFQNPSYTKDPNLSSGIKNVFNNKAITGTTFTGSTTVQVNYANTNGTGPMLPSPIYNIVLTATSTTSIHRFPIDIEYFQVITAMTYNQFSGMCVTQLPNSLNQKYFFNSTRFFQSFNRDRDNNFNGYTGSITKDLPLRTIQFVREGPQNYVVILNRGVDPYTSKIDIEYGLGRLFGYSSVGDVKVKGSYRMNIPIQGSFFNISHLSSDRTSITPPAGWTPLTSGATSSGSVTGPTWVGGNSVTAGSNVEIDTGYAGFQPNVNQHLYFNSFSYCPNQRENWEYVTGYTQGLTAVTWTQKTSRFSGFNSNLISYYSNLDRRSLNYTPTCNNIQPKMGTTWDIDDIAPFPQTPSIGPDMAVASIQGLRVSGNNGFTRNFFFRTYTIYNDHCTANQTSAVVVVNFMDSNLTSPYDLVTNYGYIPREIVEGSSLLGMTIPFSYVIPSLRGTPSKNALYGPQYDSNSSINCMEQYPFQAFTYYYSPIYATTANTMNFTLGTFGTTFLGMTENQIVMRGDRLPTSTNVEEYCCNGRVLHKNNNFAIYQIPEKGVIGINSLAGAGAGAGTGNLDDVREDLQGSPNINKVINTFTCEGSVNLQCYDCNKSPVNSTIFIRPRGNPCLEFEGETIFENGCYVFITTMFLSLARDWELMFEFIARNMVMLGACRNVFSHKFNNNWVNGVLYAFSFKNEIGSYTLPTDTPPNFPIPRFCTDVINFHNDSKNFYYRCTLFNGTEFSGKVNYPTTIMDLGPRSEYIQELVMSDEYDGYVVNRLDSTTFSHVDEILNLFIVSRFMDNNFLTNLLGPFNIFAYFKNGRDGKFMVDADYAQLISINSELGVAPFQSSNYPDAPTVVGAGGFVTGVQYRILSGGTAANQTNFTSIGSTNNTIGTTFIATGFGSGDGTAIVDPAIQNPIFFDCDNSIGIFYTSDLQIRDYITPKRTIINPTGTTGSICTFNNFPVYSQIVPLSQWLLQPHRGNRPSIFGGESNDWDYTNIYTSRYQSLDRLLTVSRYFRTKNIGQHNFRKGYIYAVTDGNSLSDSPSMQNNSISALVKFWDQNTPDSNSITVGAPFHFYFGLKRGKSSFDRFRAKWINVNDFVV